MKKFVPYEKLSKKEKRAHDLKRRVVWDNVRPVTRVIKSKKVYDRKRSRGFYEKEPRGLIFSSDIPKNFRLPACL